MVGRSKHCFTQEHIYDDVFVNQEIVKKDYAVGCTGKLKTEYDELVNKIKEKFPNEYDFNSNKNNIIWQVP